MTRRTLALSLVFTCLAAGPAAAALTTHGDGQGNTIVVDNRTKGGQPAKYAQILAETTHGDEINDVTIRIVSRAQLNRECHPSALACYGAEPRMRPLIFVPPIPASKLKSTLVHEYGHHVDQAYTHRSNAPNGLDGTPRWWSARGISARLNKRKIAWDYRRGWDRSLVEIFAEDFAVTNLGSAADFDIPWLGRPNSRVKAALNKDLRDPVGLTRRHVGVAWLRKGTSRTVPFRLTGSRKVTIITAVRNPGGKRPIESVLTCNGVERGRATATTSGTGVIRAGRVAAKAECEVTYTSKGSSGLLESFIDMA